MQRYQGLQLLGTLAAVAIVYTAIQRAVIFPDQKSWFSLRLSWAELRTAALAVILYIAFLVAIFVVTIVATVPVVIAVAAAGGGEDGFVKIAMTIFAVIIGVLLALAYPMGRLAMSIPMSIGENRFRLFEAWNFTRGYGWQLLLIFLLVAVMLVMIQVVMLIVLGVGAISTIGSLDPGDISAYFKRPDWVKDAMGWLMAAGACWLVLVLVSAPITVAPWAEAYRRIAGVQTQDAHSVFE